MAVRHHRDVPHDVPGDHRRLVAPVAGIGAYYLVKGRALPFARRSVSIGLGVAAILLPVQIFLGDYGAAHELPYQLSKLEALEGNWTSGNTGYVIFAIPDQQAQSNIAELSIPCLGSAISKDLSCKTGVPGLDLTPKQARPLMAPVFWGFRAMFYAALLMFGTVFYATILRFRRKLWASRRFHRFLMWTTPAGILAILGGWVTAETGRQPWVVFGYLALGRIAANYASRVTLHSAALRRISAARLAFYDRAAAAPSTHGNWSGDALDRVLADADTSGTALIQATAPAITAAALTGGGCLATVLAGYPLAALILALAATACAVLATVTARQAGDVTQARSTLRTDLVSAAEAWPEMASLDAAGQLAHRARLHLAAFEDHQLHQAVAHARTVGAARAVTAAIVLLTVALAAARGAPAARS